MRRFLLLVILASGVFSAEASSVDRRIRQMRSLPELLVPSATLPVVATEDAALEAAVQSLATMGPVVACDRLVAFWRRYPTSRWAPAVGVSAGILSRREGLVQEAEELWLGTWERWKSSDDLMARRWAERAVGEYALYLAWTARNEPLKDLLKGLAAEGISGTAAARLEACSGFLETDPVVILKLAAYAPGRFLQRQQPEIPAMNIYNLMRSTLAKLSSAYDQALTVGEASPHLMSVSSLSEVREVARALGFPSQVARRDPSAPILVPAIVPLVNGHSVALVAQVGDRYQLEDWRIDPVYGALNVLPEALLRSALPVWVVPDGPLPAGWQVVSEAEAEALTSH